MICPTCKKPKTADDFYYKKGTNNKVNPDCKDCVCEKHKERTAIKSTGDYFNIKEYAKIMRV